MVLRRGGGRDGEVGRDEARRDEAGSHWLQRQLRWQRALRQTQPESAHFLLLRPGDRYTMCDGRGESDLRKACKRMKEPSRPRRAEEHWDDYMLDGRPGAMRPIPGLGNIVLSLVSAALTAAVSGRVLLVENFTAAALTFGEPLTELLYENSTWRPYVEAEQRAGRAVDWWAAHDGRGAFEHFCADDLRAEPRPKVLRVFSNLYYAPLLMLNPHHRAELEAFATQPILPPNRFPRAVASKDGAAYSTGLWPQAVRTLLRPRPSLLASARRFTRANFPRTGIVLGMHIRTSMTDDQRQQSVNCVKQVVAKANASALLIVSMHLKEIEQFAARLALTVKVLRAPPAPEFQSAGADHLSAAMLDVLHLASTDGLLISRASTYGYLISGVAHRPVTVFSSTGQVSTEGLFKGVGTCDLVPSTEPVFHLMGTAVRGNPSCRAAAFASGSLPPPSEMFRISSLNY